MRLALQSLGKTVQVILPTTPVDLYNFLPGIDSCEIAEEEAVAQALPSTPLLFALDCGDRGRVGAVLALEHQELINLDHHSSNDDFGDINWVDVEAACTCQMVEQLLEELGVALTPDIATRLYTGLVFDTGRFMHSNSGPAEFNCAARLVAVGIDAATINRRLCYTKTPDDLAAQALGLQAWTSRLRARLPVLP